MQRPRWRKMTWVIIIWIVLTVAAALRFAGQDQACVGEQGLPRLQCHWDARVGFRAAIFWMVVGTIVFGILWIVTQPRQRARECPACGSEVKRGLTVCRTCGHDFALAAAGGAAQRNQHPSPPAVAPPPNTPPPSSPPPPAPPRPTVE